MSHWKTEYLSKIKGLRSPRISYSSIFRRIRKSIGTFRSESGSQNYQYIASLLSTWRLQGRSMFVEMDKILRRELCGFG